MCEGPSGTQTGRSGGPPGAPPRTAAPGVSSPFDLDTPSPARYPSVLMVA